MDSYYFDYDGYAVSVGGFWCYGDGDGWSYGSWGGNGHGHGDLRETSGSREPGDTFDNRFDQWYKQGSGQGY